MKTLIVYYSYTGHTKIVAQYLQSRLNCDILSLQPLVSYSDDYDVVVSQGKDEVNRKFTPKLQNLDVDFDKYDTIILGSPIWWYTFSPVMRSFLTFNDIKNKSVYAFFTNGGYGLGYSISDLKDFGLKVNNYLEVPFEENEVQISYAVIDDFADKIN